MKHPAIMMRGTGVGTVVFVLTDEKGNILMTSRAFDEEDQVREAVKELFDTVTEAADNIIDQLPSTIAHK